MASGSDSPAERPLQLGTRMRSRPEQNDPPAFASRQRARGQGGEQAGPQDRRLAASGRADDAHQRRVDGAGDNVGDEPLTAEEILRVGDVEGGETLERAQLNAARPARGFCWRCGAGSRLAS